MKTIPTFYAEQVEIEARAESVVFDFKFKEPDTNTTYEKVVRVIITPALYQGLRARLVVPVPVEDTSIYEKPI